MTQVLLINSDLAANRGDRAIAEGNIELIKQQFPDAHIIGLSEFPERDRWWYGIDFVNMNFQSLSPLAFIRLIRIARSSDVVFWGGGEILKDYTNKAALWYWTFKITLLSRFNPNIYGAFQGIGPTKSAGSRRLITRVVDRCKMFIVRDQESAAKLIEWGAEPSKIRAASDPAILPSADPVGITLRRKLESSYDIDEHFLTNYICIGPRDWFHYTPGGIIPFKYKRKLFGLVGRSPKSNNTRHRLYVTQLKKLVSTIASEHPDLNILFVPMHMGESDSALCRKLANSIHAAGRVRVLDSDNLSPSELRSIVGGSRAMIGFRLHSTIIGTSAGVPSINLYYVDKGRVYFDQIGQSAYALPIECSLDANFVTDMTRMLDKLLTTHDDTSRNISKAITRLQQQTSAAFEELFS